MKEIKDNAKIIEETLRDMGEPIRLKDLVELTIERVSWRDQKKQTQQMITFMKKNPTIVKSRQYGSYVYLPEGEKEVLKRGRKPKSENTKIKKAVKKKEEAKKGMSKEFVKEDKPEDILITEVVVESGKEEALTAIQRDEKILEDFRSFTQPVLQDIQEKSNKGREYKNGDTFDGTVTGVEEYGAFVENEDGTMQGLIHISNIRNGIVNDPNKHFKLGDKVTAKVIGVKGVGKLSLSAKGFELPDYFKREDLKDKPKPFSQHVIEEENIEEMVEEVALEERITGEYAEIFKFVQSITGVVSIPAREKLINLIEKEGVFKFTVALTEAKRDFEVDVSMLLAKEIEEKMSGHL